jgi:hypothetical protein
MNLIVKPVQARIVDNAREAMQVAAEFIEAGYLTHAHEHNDR